MCEREVERVQNKSKPQGSGWGAAAGVAVQRKLTCDLLRVDGDALGAVVRFVDANKAVSKLPRAKNKNNNKKRRTREEGRGGGEGRRGREGRMCCVVRAMFGKGRRRETQMHPLNRSPQTCCS